MRLKANKYGAKRTEVDGHTFASKKEAARYQELKLLEKAGEIHNLELQPKFQLCVVARGADPLHRGIEVGTYIADFRYRLGPRGILVVEDVKGVRTPLYRWKKRHVEAQYNIRITEI